MIKFTQAIRNADEVSCALVPFAPVYQLSSALKQLPGSVAQAGQIAFWNQEHQQYETPFEFHVWILTPNRDIYDSYYRLEKAINPMGGKATLPPAHQLRAKIMNGVLMKRYGTIPRLMAKKRFGADILYLPGTTFSETPLVIPVLRAIAETAESGSFDVMSLITRTVVTSLPVKVPVGFPSRLQASCLN